jgi:signal transduction histidine kinase
MLRKLWRMISKLGITPQMPNVERIRVTFLNQAAFTVFTIQILLLFNQIFIYRDQPTFLLYILIAGSGSILLFQYFDLLKIARAVLNIAYPLLMFITLIQYGPDLNGEYTFFIFFLTSLLFYEERWIQISLVAFNMGLFLLSFYLNTGEQHPLAHKITPADPTAIFLATGLCITIIVSLFVRENKKHEAKMQHLLSVLRQKNEDLEKTYKELENFADITSHDLRAPLRTIHSFVTLLTRDIERGKSQNLPKYFKYIKGGAQKMYTLIEDILSFSKMEHLSNQPTRLTDLNLMLEEVVEEIKAKYSKKIQLTTNRIPIVVINPAGWRIMLRNIIENAVKYNDSPEVQLKISSSLKDHAFKLSIYDNGIGIADDYHDQIFDMFTRLHTDDSYSGSGLGLSICKKIVDKMNGRIEVDSVVGEGTCFSIIIPYTLS